MSDQEFQWIKDSLTEFKADVKQSLSRIETRMEGLENDHKDLMKEVASMGGKLTVLLWGIPVVATLMLAVVKVF